MQNSISDNSSQSSNVIALPTRLEDGRFARLSILALQAVPTGALKVYCSLVMHAGESNYCWPSISVICADTKSKPAWVYRCLARLEAEGFIESDGDGWTICAVGEPENSTIVEKDSTIVEIPTSKEKKKKTIYGGTTMKPTKLTNMRRASESDDQPTKQQTGRIPTPRRQAILSLAAYFTAKTKLRVSVYDNSHDLRVLGQLWDDYGEEAREIVDTAYEQRESLATDKFPKFTLSTVAFFAKFKYVPKEKIDFETLVRRNTSNGQLDENNFAKACFVHGVSAESLRGRMQPEVWERVRDKLTYFNASKRSRNPEAVSRQDG